MIPNRGGLIVFLISGSLVQNVATTYISPGYRTDHSLISLKFSGDSYKRGKSYWKFNNSLLRDSHYVNEVKKIISNVKKQYSVPVYDIKGIDEIPNEDLQFTINDQLFFEVLLMEIRGKTISYSSYRKREDNKAEAILNEEIAKLEQKTDDSNRIASRCLNLNIKTLKLI